jgi:hypothetical protein
MVSNCRPNQTLSFSSKLQFHSSAIAELNAQSPQPTLDEHIADQTNVPCFSQNFSLTARQLPSYILLALDEPIADQTKVSCVFLSQTSVSPLGNCRAACSKSTSSYDR